MIKITAACARARADQGAFFAADQRPAYGPDGRSNSNVLRLAMMVTVRSTVRHSIRGKSQEQKYEGQKYCQYVLLSNSSYHFQSLH